MLFIVVIMVVILAIAGVVIAYVAFPHHGESLPAPARLLGQALARATDAVPTIDADDGVTDGYQRASLFD